MSVKSEKEKILIVSTGLGLGGAERSLYNFLVAGAAEKYECIVLSLRDDGYWGDEFRSIGVEVLALNLHRPIMWRQALKVLKKILNLKHVTTIQGWMYHGNLAAFLFRILVHRKAKILWSIRQTLYELNKEKILTQLIIRICAHISAHVDRIIYNSKVSMEQHQKLGFVSDSILIENGFDEDAIFPKDFDKQKFRKQFGCSKETLIVGHVARFHPMKNQAGFIKAMMKLCDEKPYVNVFMIGRGVPTLFRDKIPEKHKKNFFLLEETSDVYKFMCIFDVFCLSSSWGEGFPNVLAEAMLLKTPCVSTDVGDAKRILGGCGIVVNQTGEDALYRGLKKIISMTEQERLELGVSGHERIKHSFSLTAQAIKIKTIWNL